MGGTENRAFMGGLLSAFESQQTGGEKKRRYLKNRGPKKKRSKKGDPIRLFSRKPPRYGTRGLLIRAA